MAFTFPEWLTIRFPTSALIAMASQENKEVSYACLCDNYFKSLNVDT